MRRLGDAKRWRFSPARARCRQTSSTFNYTQAIQLSTQHLSVRTQTKATSTTEVAFFICAYERTVRTQPV